MIEARELRIGNLVFDALNGDLTLRQENLCDFANGFIHLQPIPLTEEWLIKFGFELVDSHDDHLYYLSETDFSLDRNMQFDNSYKRVELKFVHSLQNLYFALTNKELIL